MAPEYATRGYLTNKADVYSFGIVALEVVSGKRNSSWRAKEERFYLLDWAHVLRENNQLKELIDPRLGLELNEVEALRLINTALLCTSTSPTDRPTMSIALSMLEGRTEVPATISDPNRPSSHSNSDIISEQSGNDQLQSPDQSQSKSLLMDPSIPSFTNSSISGSDLYPFNPSSQYSSGKDH
ncbi:putative LRR receptor-like serine/threonine-protein kinase [Acorus gramineus]|uniref:LRR receptor-like serine/threonine-protein kinase n=1 Tax=Acorus gramineus TaxID=55184 RepID=A0AAV9BJE7_ACOGR|nr:putative LRR receptor-like serine/threonine-protein kinase [Acorus gramineus]